jgi:hypothetical protein
LTGRELRAAADQEMLSPDTRQWFKRPTHPASVGFADRATDM